MTHDQAQELIATFKEISETLKSLLALAQNANGSAPATNVEVAP